MAVTPPHPSVSVVIASRDRCRTLMRTLAHHAALPEHPRVVVVDDASSDGTARRVAREASWAHLIVLPRSAGAAARTAGVRAAPTPYVAFSDDDSWWAPGALTSAAAVLDRDPRIAVVCARVLVGPERREDPICRALAASPLPAGPLGPSVMGFLACGAVVRREAYLAVGGFEERLGVGGEEELLAVDLVAAGWSLVYRDDVVAFHHPPARDDAGARRRRQARNALWCAWLRRPAARATAMTVAMARRAVTDRSARGGLVDAVRHGRWVVSRRRVVDPLTERSLAAVEACRAGGG